MQLYKFHNFAFSRSRYRKFKMEHSGEEKKERIYRYHVQRERVENSRDIVERRARARARAYAVVVARACFRVYGEAVTHPVGEGERTSPVPAAGNNGWGWGSIYRLEKHSPAVSGNCVASRSSSPTGPPHSFPRFSFLPSLARSLALLPIDFLTDSEADRFSFHLNFASEKRPCT